MNIRKLGLWSSAVSLAAFIGYTLCFAAIYFINPPFVWTNPTDFITYTTDNAQIFKYIAMALMIVFSVSFIIQLECLREVVCDTKRFFARIASHFAIAFSALIGISYFVQISAVPLQIAAGQTESIGQFVQSNPNSFISAVNLLGWTVFFGIACVLAALAMGKGYKERIIKYAFLANGIMMLASSVAYVFSFTIIQALFMFLGLGAATIVESIAMCGYFKSKPVGDGLPSCEGKA